MADQSLIPAGIRDARSEALASLIDGPGTIDLTPILVNYFDTVPASALPFLVERFALQEFITDETPEAAIRNLLKSAFELHRYKGTRYAVRRALESLGINAVITEWFEKEPEGAPYTFEVLALANNNFSEDGLVLSAKRQAQAERLVRAVKPVSRSFTLTLGAEFDASLRFAAVVRPIQIVKIEGVL